MLILYSFLLIASPQPGVPEPGDIIFRLRLVDESPFELKGLDLLTVVHVDMRDALMGFDKRTVLVHLDGRHIQVEKKDGRVTRPGSLDRLVGEGMPRERDIGERGDLYIKWQVRFPEDGWLQGRDEATRSLSSVLPPPRSGIQAESEEVELVDTSDMLEEAKGEDVGRNQPKKPQEEEEFWEDETEAPAGGCAGQ